MDGKSAAHSGGYEQGAADSKAALAEARDLDDVDDLDELIASIEKSTAEHRALIKSIEAGTKAFSENMAASSKAMSDQIAKLAAEVDTKGTSPSARYGSVVSSSASGPRRSRRAIPASTLKNTSPRSKPLAPRCESAPNATPKTTAKR